LQENLTQAPKKKSLKADLPNAHHADWLLKEMAKDSRFENHETDQSPPVFGSVSSPGPAAPKGPAPAMACSVSRRRSSSATCAAKAAI
jgi:hypothetical protein